jgi:hypothetical protein
MKSWQKWGLGLGVIAIAYYYFVYLPEQEV